MIKITDFIIHRLSNTQDPSGEYSADFDFDFMLSESCEFTIYGTRYTIDRIKMYPEYWSDEANLAFSNGNMRFDSIVLPRHFVELIFERLKSEEKDGKLKDWCFSDQLEEMLESDDDA